MLLGKSSFLVFSLLVAISVFMAYQHLQGINDAKDSKISYLLERIESKNLVISKLKDSLYATPQISILQPANSNNSTNSGIQKSKQTYEQGSEIHLEKTTIQNVKQTDDSSSQLEQLSESLEKKNITLKKISQLAPFSKIPLTDDNRDDYFERIAEITEGSLYNTEYLMNVEKYGKVSFNMSDSAPPLNDTTEDTSIFKAANKRLYAHFDLPDYAYDQVLVKWYKEGVNELVQMDYLKINQFGSENYIWIEQDSTWESGKYLVEIFSASETPALLSAGDYIVIN